MKKFLYGISFVLFIVILFALLILVETDGKEVTLSKCIDGDTAWFLIEGEEVKVRFLGINAPEIAHEGINAEMYGDEAKDYMCSMLEGANHIYLKYDIKGDRVDKYGRTLAWVFVDDKNLNELLVKNGYAEVRYIYDDYLYVDDLCRAQEKAYRKNIRIWSVYRDEYQNNYCNKKRD